MFDFGDCRPGLELGGPTYPPSSTGYGAVLVAPVVNLKHHEFYRTKLGKAYLGDSLGLMGEL